MGRGVARRAPGWGTYRRRPPAVEPDLDRLTAYLTNKDEVEDKRFSHKRAFMLNGVLIELFLVQAGSSLFWDNLLYEWPDLAEVEIEGLAIAPINARNAYRRDYDMIRAAAPRLG